MVVHTLNLLPITTLSFKTPFEVIFGLFPKYDHLCVFGYLCYPNISFTSHNKFYAWSTVCVYLDPAPDHKRLKGLDLVMQHVIITRHVIFDEDHFPYCDFYPSPIESDYDCFTPDDDIPLILLSPLTPSPTQHVGSSSSPILTLLLLLLLLLILNLQVIP